MAKARIEYYNGEPAIVVDGKVCPPMTMTVDTKDGEYIKKLGEAGIRIFYVTTAMRWNTPVKENQPDIIAETFSKIELLLKYIPSAYIILRLNVNPCVEWINSHPEEQIVFNDGTHQPVICTSAGTEPLDGMVSFASEKWRKEGAQAVREYIAEMKQNPVFDRVIGFFLGAGGTGEWYYPSDIRIHNYKKGTYADFSEPFRKSFGLFLKDKYKTEEELRRVWKREDVTFENPIIPNLTECAFVHEVDAKIADGMEHWESAAYTVGAKTDLNATAPTNIGVFLNANEYLYAADFFDALHQATADTIIHFGNVLKECAPDLLVGAFYGYFGCTDYYEASHTTGVISLLDADIIDFLAGPGVYNNREPGGVVAQREMQDSFRIRNKIFIAEDDSRTHHALPSIQREAMGLYRVEDSINTLKRDFARDICEDIQGWWFDMGCKGTSFSATSWYNDPDILSLFKEQQEIAQFAYSQDRTKKNEIAVIYDTESVHTVSDYTNKMVLDYFRTSDLHRIGAPIDYYFHNDLSNPNMPDYKLYIMLNTYCLTNTEREAVFEKARKNHATVLWLYAPGFINFSAEKVMDIKNIEKTIGMKLSMKEGTVFPYFKIDPKTHTAVKKANEDRKYGYIDRDVHSCIWITKSELMPAFANPGFTIKEDEKTTVLGRFCIDNSPALAMRDDMGFVSVYCATPVIRSEIIASIAEFAGCHIYTDSEDVLYANENFVAIHASFSGKRRIKFSKPCDLYEVYEKQCYGEKIDTIDLEMKKGETKMFYKKTNY